MFVYIVTLLLANTCCLSSGTPVTNTNGPPVSIALENLAKTCESSLLASTINTTLDQCRYDVTQRPSYKQKQQFECLLFLDINTQLCSAVAVNHLNVLKEDMVKITQQVDVEQLCSSAKDWKTHDIHDYPLYNSTFDKVFSSEINCARVCSVEDVTSEDSNFFCKYYKWGMELLAHSNSETVQQANKIPVIPAHMPSSQQQPIPQQQTILQQQPNPQQPIPQLQPIPEQQQPIPQLQPISQQQSIPQQQPIPQQLIPKQHQVPDISSEKGRVNLASSKSTEVEAHSVNAATANQTQKGDGSQPDAAEMDEVSFQQPPSATQNQNQQSNSITNNAVPIGVSSKAQKTAQPAGGSLNDDNTASLDNPSDANIALKDEQSEISDKPARKEKGKNGILQANPDVDYQDDDDKLQNFGDTQGVDDTDPDNLGDVEDRFSVDQTKSIVGRTESFANTNIMPDYSDDDEDHFFSFFLTVIIVVVLLYILYHNKNKFSKVFFGLILEGRQGRRRNSRGHAYRRLDTLEQAMSTNSAAPPSKIIY